MTIDALVTALSDSDIDRVRVHCPKFCEYGFVHADDQDDDERMVFVAWDSGVSTPVDPSEIELAD